MRNIAGTIGEGLSLPVRNISGNEAPAHFTWLSTFVSLDSPASSAITRETLGWEPEEIGLLEDMRAHYFSPVEQV